MLSNQSKETEKKSYVEKLISNNRVIIFSKSWCPSCTTAKNLFDSLKVEYKAIELDLMGEEGDAIHQALIEKTKMRTIPNIFIKGQHIGGCDNTLQAHRDGRLMQILEDESDRESRHSESQ